MSILIRTVKSLVKVYCKKDGKKFVKKFGRVRYGRVLYEVGTVRYGDKFGETAIS